VEAVKRLLADRRRVKNVLVLAFVVVLVNLPLALSTWTNIRVESAGTDVTATVTAARNLGTEAEPRWWVSYRFPEDVDPAQGTWAAEVDRDTWSAAERSGTITVRVLEGEPTRHTVVGEVRSWAGLWTTLVADAVLLAFLLLVWRLRGRRTPQHQVVEALTDVSPAPPGEAWEDLGDGTATVVGVVARTEPDFVVLELDDRVVRVILDHRTSSVPPGETASVRVRLPEA
jgi:hypothetical protein